MKHTPSSSSTPLRKLLGWTLLVALGASLGTALAVKAMAAATTQATAISATTASPTATAANGNVPASTMAHSCAACHGTNGELGDEYFMPLAGMPVQQFVRTMTDFREGKRPATLMGHVARGFTDADLQAMGEFFAAVKPATATTVAQGAQ